MRNATIRTRVALVATALAVTALVALGYQQLSTLSATFSRVAEEQSMTLASQLAGATAGTGAEVVSVIPYSEQGLDGVVVFDRNGKPRIGSGGLAPQMRDLGAQARSVAQSRKPLQQFQGPDGDRVETLRPWSPDGTIQVTLIPQNGGTMAVGFHIDWATRQMRTSMVSTSMALAGGALFICFGLLLMMGRFVTRPLARLASEVRRLAKRDADPLSEQASPELQELASDIWQMHEDLTKAIHESATDPLTGIANHRAFQERIEASVVAATRTGEPLALVALDLDHLKTLNDSCGHVAGDRVIVAVARELAAACGERDLAARIGGDEFAVLCPGRDHQGATELAERVAATVACLSVERLTGRAAPAGFTPSVSYGVADLGTGITSKDDLMHAADAALYERKFSRPAGGGGAAPAAQSPATPQIDGAVRALALAVDAKDSGTHSHCETVAALAVEAGQALRLDEGELESLHRAALLHDVGKIGTPDAVLLKPSRLTDDEFKVMKQHPGLGYRIVRSAGLSDREASWILHHHEHLDGSGYPHGLRGDEIPLQSRIILVADAFEAMTSDRPYRKGRPAADAVAELRRCAGRQFDPAVVEVVASLVAARDGGAIAAGDAAEATAR